MIAGIEAREGRRSTLRCEIARLARQNPQAHASTANLRAELRGYVASGASYCDARSAPDSSS